MDQPDYLLDSPFESPTLIITGRQDRVTGYQDAWDLIENIPRETFAVLDRASHFRTNMEEHHKWRYRKSF